jgi:DNA-binding response OmpR family regulator
MAKSPIVKFVITAKYNINWIGFGDRATHILVVDDDEDNLELFCEMLRIEGFMVEGYTDANSALSHFKPDLYSLIILDCLLPNLNGLQLYDKLRPIDNSVNAVLLTATEPLAEQGEKQGSKVIKKPIYPSQLMGIIRRTLNTGQFFG